MPEMILDSLFLITNAYIDKHGKLPVRICVRRSGVSRLYHITKVLDIACKVTGMKRPKTLNNFKHVQGILHKAMCDMHRKRRHSPYHALTRASGGNVEYRENIVNLRPGYCNVNGLGAQRLRNIIQGKNVEPTPQEAEHAMSLLRAAELIVVESEAEAYRIQFFLTDRGLPALVVYGEAADKLNLPSTDGVWSKPTVEHQ